MNQMDWNNGKTDAGLYFKGNLLFGQFFSGEFYDWGGVLA